MSLEHFVFGVCATMFLSFRARMRIGNAIGQRSGEWTNKNNEGSSIVTDKFFFSSIQFISIYRIDVYPFLSLSLQIDPLLLFLQIVKSILREWNDIITYRYLTSSCSPFIVRMRVKCEERDRIRFPRSKQRIWQGKKGWRGRGRGYNYIEIDRSIG